MHRYYLAAILVIGPAASAVWADSQPAAQDQRIGELVKQLGSSRFSEREKARHELEAIGAPALAALRKATKSPDLETSRRATDLVRLVEQKLTATRMLAPKHVRLNLKDVSVLDAVKQLEKQSGYRIQVQGNPDDRKITLDTGESTFWQALDKLSARAGLVELTPTSPFPGQPGGVPGIRIQPALPGVVLPMVPPPGAPKKGPVLQVQGAAAAQVQAQPLPLQPPAMPFPPGFGGFAGMPMANNGVITLTPSKAPRPPTCYAGAVRIRLISNQKIRAGETQLTLDVAAEPRVRYFSLEGDPRLDLAVDDLGQKLEVSVRKSQQPHPMAPPAAGMPMMNSMMSSMMSIRQAFFDLKLGEKEAKRLKELKGTLTARALTETEPLITVENILTVSGKTVKGAGGGSIQVHGVDKTANGDYQVRFRLENPPGPPAPMMMPGGAAMQLQQIQIQIGGNVGGKLVIGGGMPAPSHMPALVDRDGKAFRLVAMPSMRMTFANGQMSQEATLVFRSDNAQGAPDRLVYSGQRSVSFSVPFTFNDVPF